MLKEATYSLHRATHDRSYLKDVTILIPESWEQLGLTNNVATWENVEVRQKRAIIINMLMLFIWCKVGRHCYRHSKS